MNEAVALLIPAFAAVAVAYLEARGKREIADLQARVEIHEHRLEVLENK